MMGLFIKIDGGFKTPVICMAYGSAGRNISPIGNPSL